jgi:hypothetical protein
MVGANVNSLEHWPKMLIIKLNGIGFQKEK